MKMCSYLWLVIALCFAGDHAIAQEKAKPVSPYRLSISTTKTTNIIFPFAVKSADRGSMDVLVQKLKGADNILQVKAGKAGFDETNLSVVTADGKFYSFILDYAVVPNVLNLSFLADSENKHAAARSDNNAGVLWEDCRLIDTQARHVVARDRSSGMSVVLAGIFVHEDVLYFKVRLHNTTKLNYPIDMVHFSITDEQKGKRYAIQNLDKVPVYCYNQTDVIRAGDQVTMIYAIPSFTIPDKKYLSIEIMEKNGGRHLVLHVKAKTVLKARPVRGTKE